MTTPASPLNQSTRLLPWVWSAQPAVSSHDMLLGAPDVAWPDVSKPVNGACGTRPPARGFPQHYREQLCLLFILWNCYVCKRIKPAFFFFFLNKGFYG